MDLDDSIGPTRPPPQACKRHLDDDIVHFTPVKSSTAAAPRAWERKPSTSFLARSKSRKVWKRFRSSFNSMKALQQLMGTESGKVEEKELTLEINLGRNPAGLARGIKRRCLAVQESGASTLTTTEENNEELGSQRGRSFLETKWELDVTRKRRKLPASQCFMGDSDEPKGVLDDLQLDDDLDEEMVDNGDAPVASTSIVDSVMQQSLESDESSALTPGVPTRLAVEAAYPRTQPGKQDHPRDNGRGVISNIKALDDIDVPEIHQLLTSTVGATTIDRDAALVTTPTKKGEDQIPANTADAPASKLTAVQESTLVRSALRSSLGGDDTELLNNFLSRAKAKREAKAAEAAAAGMIAQDAEEPAKSEEVKMPRVVVEIPTPDRRVLEDLDANSPSPLKAPVSPSKLGDEADENAGDKGSVPVSPVGRRSTRARAAKPVMQRPTAPTAVRSAFSLRRPKGNEFVFLQRTEAQELALLTRRNTRQNKGDSLLPKHTLQGLARRTPEATGPTDIDEGENNSQKSNGNIKAKKRVSWNDEQLVEFEGGDNSNDEEVTNQSGGTTTKSPEKRKAASGRTSRSQTSSKTGGDGAAAAATTAPPRARRVRRLGPSKPDPAALAAITTTANPSDDSASPASSPPPSTASPAPKRKKLTPKSPKASLLRTPSKVSSSSSGSSGDDKSLLGGGRSVKTSLLKVNAGSTPMPRRVRSRT